MLTSVSISLINNLTIRKARRVVPTFNLLCSSIANNNIFHLKSNGIISLAERQYFFSFNFAQKKKEKKSYVQRKHFLE